MKMAALALLMILTELIMVFREGSFKDKIIYIYYFYSFMNMAFLTSSIENTSMFIVSSMANATVLLFVVLMLKYTNQGDI